MFKQRLHEVETEKVSTYRVLDLALDTARIDEKYPISASFIYVLTFDGTNLGIRLNEKTNDLIPLKERRALTAVVSKIFINHTAQAGKVVKLIFGISEDFYIEDT